jgi:hypothetical protein
VANALTSQLAEAEAHKQAGQRSNSINTLNAVINLIEAQKGKHITLSCTINNTTFDPAAVLITDVQSLIVAP